MFWRALGCALLLGGCSGEEQVTFASLGPIEARASADLGRCHCPSGTICIICTGPEFDRYAVTFEDPEAGEPCLEGEEQFGASWAPASSGDLTPSVDLSCRRLQVTVEVSAGDAVPEGILNISDGSGDWTIDAPFRSPVFELMAEVPAGPDRLAVTPGEQLELAFSGAEELTEVSANFQELPTPREVFAASVEASGTSLVVTVPELASGAHTFSVHGRPVLPADACQGPQRCLGLSGSLKVDVYVP